MKLVPLEWFNDTKEPQLIFFDTLSNVQTVVNPGSSVSLEYPLVDSKRLFIKVWHYGDVLISAIDKR